MTLHIVNHYSEPEHNTGSQVNILSSVQTCAWLCAHTSLLEEGGSPLAPIFTLHSLLIGYKVDKTPVSHPHDVEDAGADVFILVCESCL